MSDAGEQIERVLEKEGHRADADEEQPLEVDTKPDRTRRFTHTSFSRVRTGWQGDDAIIIADLHAQADRIIDDEFRVADALMERIHRHVRAPLAEEGTGELRTYGDGSPMWETDEFGVPVEDWSRLEEKDLRNIMLTITAYLYEWERISVKKWAEAMFSKVQWEETFARGFMAVPSTAVTGKPTIDDKTQWGHKESAEERYFAIFQSYLSKQAEGVIRSMTRMVRLLEKLSEL